MPIPINTEKRGYIYGCLVAKPHPPFVTTWSVAHQAPIFMGFPRQEYGVGCHFLLQGIFPAQGLNPCFLHWQLDSLPLRQLGSLNICILRVDSLCCTEEIYATL